MSLDIESDHTDRVIETVSINSKQVCVKLISIVLWLLSSIENQ
ncbi:MAG TPA: DUF2848 domain-containing protein [Sporosarcina psychrophila]|uniref:DUF2848 domain-containing protein n=1 Tax=Sporosarcina psychrophila TaxID=1476 RepID=A0A921FWK4_SPOPS|nr:DUF2848 domain-containing protein [Sporosarcina psychrophila]